MKGNVKEVLEERKQISLEQILEAEGDQEKPSLVLIEGAPGIGKSTLAWELCKKWEEFTSIKQYDLVILLRLREEKVQQITSLDELFYSYDGIGKWFLVEIVRANQGNNVLFILDGFDELPEEQEKNFLLIDLIRGDVLPASTVIVTSRPSAMATLLTGTRPRVTKQIEILGFTQQSVQEYAASVFASDQNKLEKFKAYISANKNPAINNFMYIPLNAAIVVLIYEDSISDTFMPHTLTELYSQLCLTIVKRQYPNITLEKLEDLPLNLTKHFLSLSQIAFEGLARERNKYIFKFLPPGFNHFGFLDAEQSLYGGGAFSYNFLHLTVQEFFAAYHISSLGSDGHDVFKVYGNIKQWNGVWRFVAGLTRFQHYGNFSDLLYTEHYEGFTQLFIQTLFEAQSVKHFFIPNSTRDYIVGPSDMFGSVWTSLDMYALGYSVTHLLPATVFLRISIAYTSFVEVKSFFDGLDTKSPFRNAAVISKLCSLKNIVTLDLTGSFLTNADLIRLSYFIPRMTHLKALNISDNNFYNKTGEFFYQNGRIEYLHNYNVLNLTHEVGVSKFVKALHHSNIIELNVANTGFCAILRNSVFYSLFKRMIDPKSSKLKNLIIDDSGLCDEQLWSLLSSPSSLRKISFEYRDNFDTFECKQCYHYDPYTGACDTLQYNEKDCVVVSGVVNILKYNKELVKLKLIGLDIPEALFGVRIIGRALKDNKKLQKLELGIRLSTVCLGSTSIDQYMKNTYSDINDPRIVWTIQKKIQSVMVADLLRKALHL